MTKHISPHLLEAARQRVARCIKRFNRQERNDPRFKRWQLGLISIHSGLVSCQVKISYNTDDPLSLICRHEPELACRSDGRVKWATVSEAFGFNTSLGEKKAFYLGLHEGSGPSELDMDRGEYIYALNHAWAEAMQKYYRPTAPRLT